MYLTKYIDDNPDCDASLHDILALTYVKQLFEMKPKNTSVDNAANISMDEQIWDVLERFRKFLKENNKYDVKKVLIEMDDSWLLEEQVMLLIKTGRTYEALESYITKDRHKEAEEFCLK